MENDDEPRVLGISMDILLLDNASLNWLGLHPVGSAGSSRYSILGVSLFSTLKFSSENAQCHLDCTSYCHKNPVICSLKWAWRQELVDWTNESSSFVFASHFLVFKQLQASRNLPALENFSATTGGLAVPQNWGNFKDFAKASAVGTATGATVGDQRWVDPNGWTKRKT